jgi:hypothetical protein
MPGGQAFGTLSTNFPEPPQAEVRGTLLRRSSENDPKPKPREPLLPCPLCLLPVWFYFYALIVSKHGTKLEGGCCNCGTPSRWRPATSRSRRAENPLDLPIAVLVGELREVRNLVDPLDAPLVPKMYAALPNELVGRARAKLAARRYGVTALGCWDAGETERGVFTMGCAVGDPRRGIGETDGYEP